MPPLSPLLSDAVAPKKDRKLAAFLFGCLLATLFLLPFILKDGGYFLYFGDYNVQEIPFYQHAHQMIRSGNIGWDFYTDLGANFVGSYAFHMLGSPFFWIMLPFPTSWVPYLMGPMFVLKFGVASLTAYLYIRRFVKNKNYALLGALLYAFSGFAVYNIFFNHFVDVVALFPLLLIGLEEYVVDGKKGTFAYAITLNMMVNYFFFFGHVTFLVIYFFCRLPSPQFKIKVKTFFGLVFEVLLGCLGGLIIFLPAILAILGNQRLGNFLLGHDILFYADSARYGGILSSLFYPPEVPSSPNLFPHEGAKWSSMSAWLPLFSTVGVFAFWKNTGKNFVKRVLAVCAVCACIPILNSAFYAFNSAYYARWFYMPLLLMALATVKVWEVQDVNYKKPLLVTAVFTGFFALIGLMPSLKEGEISIGAQYDVPRFWVYVFICVLCLVLAWVLLRIAKPRGWFYRPALLALSFVIVIYSIIHIGYGQRRSFGTDYMVNTALNGEIAIEDDDFYRTDYYSAMDNLGMFWGQRSIRFFHTVVPNSVMEFYDYLGYYRDVQSQLPYAQYAARHLLSVRYIYDDKTYEQSSLFGGMPGYSYYKTIGDFDVYKSDEYIPIGFVYRSYFTEPTADSIHQTYRSRAMLAGVVLDEEGVRANSDILVEKQAETTDLSESTLSRDCEILRRDTVNHFTDTGYGFTCDIALNEAGLVFFSVPWDAGFTAYINGEEVPIYRANIGFMAVRAEVGESRIEFKYETPGLVIGGYAFIAYVAIYIPYIGFILYQNRKRTGHALHFRGGVK